MGIGEACWHTWLKDWQHGKLEPGARHEASHAHTPTRGLLGTDIALPQLVGRQVGRGTAAGAGAAMGAAAMGATAAGAKLATAAIGAAAKVATGAGVGSR